jgi:hypothetical protein
VAVLASSFSGPLDLAAVVLSFLVVVSGFVADGARWAALGLAVGVPGLLLPHVGRRLHWSTPVTWVVLVFILVLDLGVMSAIVAA